jgi:DNA primase
MLCPFHSEKTPSFRVYPGSKGWYCFGCHKGGDVLTLAEGLYQTDFKGAVREIDRLYNLGLTGEDKRTEGEKRADNAALRKQRQTHGEIARAEHDRLTERWGVLNARIHHMQSRLDAGEVIDPFDIAELICKRDRIGWKLEGEIY